MEKRAHVIGICGFAMSAVAKLLQDDGWTVTGSDENFYPPASTYVEKLGINLSTGYRSDNIPEDTSLVVIGKNAKLSPATNDEVRAAIELGIPMKSAAEILGEISASSERRLVVAGSFGKSTTTALIAWILHTADKKPGYFIGAMPIDLENTAQKGRGDFFVLEGDEYPSSHDDQSAKFLHYNAHDVIITSLVHDHVNVYPTIESYMLPFQELVQSLPRDGLLLACLDHGNISTILSETKARIATYSLKNALATWHPRDIYLDEKTTFTLMRDREPVATLRTPLLGTHNVQNIVGAAAYIIERNLTTIEEVQRGVDSFRGIARRLDKKTLRSSVPAYEGFGSSDAKARSAIEAIRAHFPERRIVVIFEPHTFSWRNRATAHWYDTTFRNVEKLFLYQTTQQISAHDQLTYNEILDRLSNADINAIKADSPGQMLSLLRGEVGENDVVLLLTSGSMDGLVGAIPKWLDDTFI